MFGVVMMTRYLQESQHPCIAEGVWLHSRQIEELGDTLIVRTRELGVDAGVNNFITDLGKTMAREEVDLKGETKQAGQAQFAGVVFQPKHKGVTDALAEPILVDRQRADFAEILPHHVQGAAADGGSMGVFDDPKFLNRLIDGDVLFAEQDALSNQRGRERLNPRDVGRARTANDKG